MQRYLSYICDSTYIYAGRLKKRWDLRWGFNRHRHFVVFFNVSVQAPTRGLSFYGYSDKLLHFSRIYDALGDTEDLLSPCIPGFPRRNFKQCVKENWSKDLVTEFGFVLFCFGGFVCFVLCPCFGSEYLPNPSFKQN